MTVALFEPRGLTAWVDDFTATATIANGLARTAFIPDSLIVKVNGVADLERTAAQITAAIMTGRELGLEPMAALRSIDVIKGTPALRAIALRALVLRAGHDIWVEESNETRAIVAGKRAGSEHTQSSTWTMDRARKLRLAGRDQWRDQPQAMLIARATAECARLIAADVLLGLPYTAEELADGYDAAPPLETPVAATTAQPKRRARRAVITAELPTGDAEGSEDATSPEEAATPSPVGATIDPASVERSEELDPESASSESSTDDQRAITARARAEAQEQLRYDGNAEDPDMISRGQSAMMHATFNALGITERADRMAMTSTIIGRQVQTSNELTRAEATRLLDELPEFTGSRFADDPTPGIDEPPL
jgi:hypothetical protein